MYFIYKQVSRIEGYASFQLGCTLCEGVSDITVGGRIPPPFPVSSTPFPPSSAPLRSSMVKYPFPSRCNGARVRGVRGAVAPVHGVTPLVAVGVCLLQQRQNLNPLLSVWNVNKQKSIISQRRNIRSSGYRELYIYRVVCPNSDTLP